MGIMIVKESGIEKKILDILREAGPEGIYQTDLVKRTGYSKGWVSEVLYKMEKNGLIRRISDKGKTKRIILSKYLDPKIGRVVRVGFVRSSEYIFVPHWIKRLKDKGLTVELELYSRVMDVVRDIARGLIHLGFAPIYTVAIYRRLDFPVRAIAGVSLNGARLFTRGDRGDLGVIGTSELSTMHTVVGSYIFASRAEFARVEYYGSPDEAIQNFMGGRYDSLAIWEPYATMIENKAAKYRGIRFEDHIGDYQCCILISHRSLDYRDIDLILDPYIESIKMVEKAQSDLSQKYSRIINIDRYLIERSIKSYIYTPYIDRQQITGIFRNNPVSIVSEGSILSVLDDMAI